MKRAHFNSTFLGRTTAVSAALAASGAMAAEPVTNYKEPSRYFTVERGSVAENRDFFIDLSTGEDIDFGGGARLGLPFGELLLNSAISGRNDADLSANEATFKYGFPDLQTGNADLDLDLAAYAGIAHIDIDNDGGDDTDFTNFVVGAAGTVNLEGFLLTVSPEIEIADDVRDDTIFNLGFAASYTFGETGFGRFQPTFEYVLIEGGDDDVNKDIDEDLISLGVRWLFKENVTLDFAMYAQSGGTDVVSVPGILRLNVSL